MLINLLPPAERSLERVDSLKERALALLQQTATMEAEHLPQRDIVVGDGETVTVHQTQFPIRTRHGHYVGYITRNITELVRLQESIKQSEKMSAIGELAGGVAHDFNNQLMGIVGGADLLHLRLRHDAVVHGDPTLLQNAFLNLSAGERAERGELQPQPELPAAFCRVLVIDDEEVVRAVTQGLLESLGPGVTACSDSRQAVELFEREPTKFDVVILDLVMPHFSGRQVLERLRAARPDVSVIVSSGHSLAGDAQRVLDLGAKWFLQKPFRVEQLDEALRHASDVSCASKSSI